MPFRDPFSSLQDIVKHIDLIGELVEGFDLSRYKADVRTRLAVERCLQNLTEAARRLGRHMDDRYPHIPWQSIRDMGSVLRHDYDEIIDEKVWLVIEADLEPLRAACLAEIERLRGE